MKIVLKLRSTWWRHPPKVKIFFDEELLWQGEISDPQTLAFDVDTTDQQSSTLCLELYDKKIDETQLDGEKIIKDQLLHIDYISIDQIDLGHLIFNGIYKPDYPEHMIKESLERNTVLPCVLEKIDTLGFNGIWSISFDHPFHIWYLENLP
jgi:hypothetical protein